MVQQDWEKKLDVIKSIYEQGQNLTQWMRQKSQADVNTVEYISIAYDFQAGTYIKGFLDDPKKQEIIVSELAETLKSVQAVGGSILEAGVGEATTLHCLINLLGVSGFSDIYGFDVSWSRVKFAQRFAEQNNIDGAQFFLGDLCSIPLRNDSINVVYTNQAIEPNTGREEEILAELYRVARNYIVLREPCYELASPEAKERMIQHGYITKLHQTCLDMGLNIVSYKQCRYYPNPLNPLAITVIEKNREMDGGAIQPFACPVSKTALNRYNDVYYSPKSMLTYPIIMGVPCLLEKHAVIATQFEQFI